ncbi:MAG: hypothetical protein ABI193_06845 [Minicystis sp.]
MSRLLRRALAALPASLLLLAAPTAQAEPQRFALSMFHFNVQYVAGGLQGFLLIDNPITERSAEQVEDAIVVESFEPVLDLYLAHPTWGADIEMQGYLLDVLAARHPGVLDKLRTLATSGQVEVVSFHYSDQLFLAYPREDWRRSQALDEATFKKYQIPRGKAVFCQEGQAGPGMAEAMASAGYENMVFPKNLFAFQHGDTAPAPLYTWGKGSMVTSQGLSTPDVDVQWYFVDDGELFATGDLDPYIAEKFKKNPKKIAEREAQITDLESKGYAVTTVSKYVAALQGKVTPVDPPPLLDGTWQPNSTDGIHRWLGGSGLWYRDERDNDVRTLGAMAHRELLAAETIAKAAGLSVQEEIDGGFRLLFLGQVSDGTGINPFRGEIEYATGHFTEALRIARDIEVRAKEALGAKEVSIDTATGKVEKEPAARAVATEIEAPLILAVTSGDRSSKVRWKQYEVGHFEVTVHFDPGDERTFTVTFPETMEDIVYTPGLLETPVHVPRDAFVFDHFELALSDGLIGLGGGRFVIKDQASVHISATIVPGSGEVVFHDDTAPGGEAIDWTFHVVDDEAKAAGVARALNVTPTVWR